MFLGYLNKNFEEFGRQVSFIIIFYRESTRKHCLKTHFLVNSNLLKHV